MSFYSRRVSIKRKTHQADAIGLKTRVCYFVAVPEQFKEAGFTFMNLSAKWSGLEKDRPSLPMRLGDKRINRFSKVRRS
jgi:hypothetical protein